VNVNSTNMRGGFLGSRDWMSALLLGGAIVHIVSDACKNK
jgi:hypothetical protein